MLRKIFCSLFRKKQKTKSNRTSWELIPYDWYIDYLHDDSFEREAIKIASKCTTKSPLKR